MTFSELNIAVRLALGFGLVLALLALLVAIGASAMAAVDARLVRIVENNNLKMDAATSMRAAQRRIAVAARNIALPADEGELMQEERNMELALADYAKAAATLDRLTRHEAGKAILERARAGQAQTEPLIDQARQLALQDKTEDATRMLLGQVVPASNAWLATLHEVLRYQEQRNNESEEQAAGRYANARLLLLIVAALAIAAVVLVTWHLSVSATGPFRLALQRAHASAANACPTPPARAAGPWQACWSPARGLTPLI